MGVVKTDPIGPVAEVLRVAAELADKNAEVAADGLAMVILNGASITCKTPLDTKTSACMILALAVPLPLSDVTPTVTKLPLELDTNVYGSPAADVKLRV